MPRAVCWLLGGVAFARRGGVLGGCRRVISTLDIGILMRNCRLPSPPASVITVACRHRCVVSQDVLIDTTESWRKAGGGAPPGEGWRRHATEGAYGFVILAVPSAPIVFLMAFDALEIPRARL